MAHPVLACEQTLLHEITAIYKLVEGMKTHILQCRAAKSYPKWSEDFLWVLARAADEELSQLRDKLEEYKSSPKSFRSIVGEFWYQLHEFVKGVTDADTLAIPYPLVKFINYQVSHLQRFPNAQILVQVIPKLNYLETGNASLRDTLKRLCERLGVQVTHRDLGFVAIPYSQADSPFLNCLMYHEVGHFMASLDSIPSVGMTFAIEEAIEKFLPKRKHEIAAHIGRWLEEVFCDLVATYLIGPAYVLAFAEFVRLDYGLASRRRLQFGNNHPPDAFRLHLQMQELVGDGWKKNLFDWVRWPDITEAASDNIEGFAAPPMYSDLKDDDWVKIRSIMCDKNRLGAICASAKAETAGREKPSDLCAKSGDWDHVSRCLSHAIVPSASADGSSVTHPIVILNAGLAFWLQSINDLKIEGRDPEKTKDRAFLEQRVETWATKAIEDWLITSNLA